MIYGVLRVINVTTINVWISPTKPIIVKNEWKEIWSKFHLVSRELLQPISRRYIKWIIVIVAIKYGTIKWNLKNLIKVAF